ncbi:hypothetical protein [Actinoallomurus spadix]|uniref:Uncharacterized protein n=1 Tax=Actinoallomurus spadix TaxID=79912 RepID=A0ABN0W539_9ACTN|nr:hypothetical protein [Actinoallomurus spadix]
MSGKLKMKLLMIAALTALIAGAMLATGSGGPESAAGRQTAEGTR